MFLDKEHDEFKPSAEDLKLSEEEEEESGSGSSSEAETGSDPETPVKVSDLIGRLYSAMQIDVNNFCYRDKCKRFFC